MSFAVRLLKAKRLLEVKDYAELSHTRMYCIFGRTAVTHLFLHLCADARGHFMWLFDSNSTKVANTNKYQTGIVQRVSKQCESLARYSSISHHPQSPGWCLIII